ncbi:hypothetical protein [Crossiella cryophila]|uniref:DUF8017 domain-containing protein n=1 Tax=Crossiella cryophila TaxID=43355 RepID=A0A7W7FWV6_9PSEU|nr:hypothetical protein [Crossiella cryophila]MBB4681921.1 hypothetical protein [Crossiella cryophila]
MTWSGDQGNRGGGEFTGAYGGLGVFGEGQPEPPKNRWRMAIIAALSLVIVVGLVMVVVLLGRDESTPPAAQTTPATSSATAGSSSSSAKSAAVQTITNTESGLTYKVPASWQKGGDGMSRTTSGPILKGMAARYPYDCGNGQFTRAEVGSGRTDDTNLTRAASDLAKYVATQGYTVDKVEPKVVLNEPKTFDNSGTTGVLVVANATAAKTSECNAPRGQVIGLAVKGAKGSSVFMLDVSYEGKNSQFTPTEDEMKQILDSVRLAK